MGIKDIINWVKGFFIEAKIPEYITPTKPVTPWPWPVVTGDYCPRETCKKKKPTVKKATTRPTKKVAAKKVAVKKPAVKKPTKKVSK